MFFFKYSSSVNKSDANEGQEQRQQRLIQQVAGNPCRGRFTTETQHKQRLEIQREQRRQKRQQETTGREHRVSVT